MNLKIVLCRSFVAAVGLLLSVGISATPVLQENTEVPQSSFTKGFELRLKAIDAYKAGAYSESVTLFKQSLSALSETAGSEAVVLWNELGAAALANGDATEAEQDFRTSARLNEGHAEPDLRELAIALRSLGVIDERRGQFKPAEDYYRRAEAVAAKGGLLSSEEAGAIFRGEGICLLKQERYQEAKPLLDKALDILRRTDPRSAAYGKALSAYSLLQLQTGHYKDAEASARGALALLANASGEESSTVATLNNLGVALTQSGRPSDGEIEFRRAVDLGRKQSHLPVLPLGEALNNLAAAEKMNGKLTLAREDGLEALTLTEQGFDDTSSLKATILNNLGLIALVQKDLTRADKYCSQAADIWAKSGGRENSKYAAALSNLAAIERARKQYWKAYEMESKALNINETVLGADHPAAAANLANLGVDLFCLKKFDEALATLERAERIQEKRLGPNSAATAYTLHNMGAMMAELKRFGDASETYDRAVHARESAVLDPYDPTLGQWEREDAAVLRKAGRFGEAEMAEVRAMKIEVKNAIRPANLEKTAVNQPSTPPQTGNGFQERTSDSPPL